MTRVTQPTGPAIRRQLRSVAIGFGQLPQYGERESMVSFQPHTVFSCDFQRWVEDEYLLLDKSGLGRLAANRQVLIKPNLVEILAPPITTPVQVVEKIVRYLLDYMPSSAIIVGEGCGASEYETSAVFAELGYTRLAQKYNIELLDLNRTQLRHRTLSDCRRWPEIYLPAILDEVFLLSVPQLKAHSIAKVTLTMKNMMGCAPPSHYQAGGVWKKAAFHTGMHEAIFELNRYRTPDYTLLDASIGMAQAHLWGPRCSPPVSRMAASSDPVAIDSYGAHLLKRRWQDVDHIVMADTVLGTAQDYTVVELD